MAADAVAIIGVSYNANDTHILDTITSVSVPIYYISADEQAAKWLAHNPHVDHVHKRFDDGLPILLDRLGLR